MSLHQHCAENQLLFIKCMRQRRSNAAFTHNTLTQSGYKLYPLQSICIACRRLHVSCIGDKIVVTATCMHLYPRVEHWQIHVDGYKLLVRDTCRRLHVSATIWCKRSLNDRDNDDSEKAAWRENEKCKTNCVNQLMNQSTNSQSINIYFTSSQKETKKYTTA